ncbi:MAG TPA: hypothetical protein VK177_20450 [Flavobacteriales bacterium]|nr:hypothetical protein [Flavobacteriales bacterium]
MNESIKNKILSTRFENDAAQGFDLVHGSEAFFNNIKSPFNPPKPKSLWGSWGFLAFEIFVVAGLLVAGKYLDFGTQATAQKSARVEVPVTVNEQPQPVNDQTAFVAPLAPEKKSVYSEQQVLNKLTDPNPVVKKDSVIVAEPQVPLVVITKPDSLNVHDPVFTYVYTNNQVKYRMRYVEDLLVVNYSDTTKKLKLDPYTSGTEAKFESKNNTERLTPVPQYKLVENTDYLIKLARPLKAMQEKRYKDAMTSFKYMLKDRKDDQNVLFYGALSLIEMGSHSKALVFLEKLKQVENPVFDEDADWLLAKVYRELGMDTKAKAILKTIANSNSFYKAQAKQELKK